MKKILFFAAAVAALLTSCQKEKGSYDSTVKGVKTITASISNSTKVVMGEDDGTVTKLNWEIGDNLLTVNMSDMSTGKYSADNAGETASFSLVDGDGINPESGHLAVYPYENMHFGQEWLGLKFTFSGNQNYTANSFDKSAMPLLAINGEGETDFTFNAMAPVLRLKVKLATAISDVKVNSVVIESAHNNLAGTSAPANDLGCFIEPDPEYGEVSKSITLDCSDEEGVAINNTAATQFNIVLPPNEYPSGDLTITIKTNKGDIVKTSGRAAIFAEGEVYNINVSGDPTPALPAGALPGEFSVSATKKVHFSQGNLTYNVSTTTWAFYEHQYNCATGYDANLISLFTWGYGDWSAVPTTENYLTSHTGEPFSPSEDWGSQIGDGKTWQTLSKDEWEYLFNNHTKKWATVNGVNGYVIAPDGFEGTLADSYADDAALAAAGNLVFLPAAGGRYGSFVDYVGGDGSYWSSTADGSNDAYLVFFSGDDVSPISIDTDRDHGASVRLITVVK